jgi:NADH-quinone oxidoreductase subunit B
MRLQEKIAAETLSTKGIRAKYAGSRRTHAGAVTRPLLHKPAGSVPSAAPEAQA